MLRALSTRRSRRGYEHLAAAAADDDGEPAASTPAALQPAAGKLSRAKSLPAKAKLIFTRSSKNSSSAAAAAEEEVVMKKAASKVHPLFSLFETSRRKKKKASAKPEFSRYLEYVREGGVWDFKQNMPVIYYKS